MACQIEVELAFRLRETAAIVSDDLNKSRATKKVHHAIYLIPPHLLWAQNRDESLVTNEVTEIDRTSLLSSHRYDDLRQMAKHAVF